MGQVFHCKTVSRGVVQGEALISTDPVLFYCTDPTTGKITEAGHSLEGISVKDKILIMPGGKGSSVVQADGMYRLDKHGTAPKGLIVQELDTVLVSSAVIMEMPMAYQVEEAFYRTVRNGDQIRIDTEKQTIERLHSTQEENG